MVDFQSGLWYSDKGGTFCIWYGKKPDSALHGQPAYFKTQSNEWIEDECEVEEDDRIIVDFLLTSWA